MSHSYIPIPEELVVAMIDLAASLVESSIPAWDCAKAQMTIVVTLCCDPNKESLSSDWVIPGIQQPLGDMVYSWLQFLRMDDKDRPVGVTKALEDLALAGWMPRKDIFAHLLQPILYFLETETSSLSDLNTFLPLSNMLSAMASLLSRVTMPNEYVIPMLRILSRLMIDLAQEDAATCRNEAQRVVGSLLSNEVSAMTTVDYLLSLYDAVNFGSQGCKLPSGDELFSWDDDTTRVCKLGGSSIRVLCEALWGDGAEQSSIALLRIFWRPLLDLLFTGLASLLRNLEDLTPDTEPMNYLSGLMVDILCAFGNSLRNEADPKTGNMSTIEWQCVTEEFVKNIKPCLLIQNSDMVTVEAKSKVQIMCSCLEHYAANENAPFTEYEFQRRLYIGLLRQVAPILTDTSLCVRLNSAIFACWAKFGMFPYRLEGWSETASDLLEESFRKRSNGVFYQTPEVRLFILKTLTRNNSVVNEMKNEESMNLPPSLLELTRHAEEEHLEFVQSAIFTILNEILGEFSAPGSQVKYDEDSPSALPVPSSRGSFTKLYPCCTTSDLLLYAVKLVGVLFYSYLENVRQCQQCVELLGAVSRDFFQHSPSSCSSSDLIHSYNIRLAALFELQKCLENVFVSTSPCHACIPTMVESFCAVLTDFSLAREAQPSSANVYHALLAVAALEPMARLQVTFDGCVAFQRNGAPPYCFDPELLLTASRIDCGSAYADAVKHRNVRIVQLGEGRRIPSPDLTVLDFGSVLSAVSVFLRSPKLPPRDGQVELNETLAYMRVSCFQILRHLAVSMVPTAELLGSMNIIFDLPKLSGFTTDMMTKIRDMTVAQLLESELVLHHLDGAEEEYEVSMNIKEFLGILFPDRDDYIREEVLSREMVTSLCLCLTSLGSPPLDNVRGLAFAVLAKIVCATEPQNDIFDIRLPVSGPILTIVHDLLLNSPAIRIPNELKQTLVRKLLFQVHRGISNQASLTENHSYRTYLAIRCLTAILDRLDTKGLQLLAAEFRKSVEMPPNSGEAILELLRNLTNEKSRILPNKYRDDERVFRRYELLSREASLISNFTAGSSAAWLSGEATLVTCRLGASSTRYQGFIEVVVRTLTGKHRELIKIQGGAILDNPETISGSSTMSPQNARTRSGLEPPGNPWAFADKTAQRAAAVLARFEAATTHSSDSSCRREVVHVAKPKAEEKFDVTGSEAPEIALWLFHALNGAPSDISGVLSDIVVFLALVGIDVDACKSLQRLQDGANLDRAIGVLDRIPHGNTHKVALLYDAIDNSPKPSVDSDNHLLSTTKCSPAFHRFANYLGEIVPIQSLGYFSGGLDTSSDESDGAFSLLWNDSDDSCDVAATSIVFHAISLLPNVGPLSFVNRKRHVGNDFVVSLITTARKTFSATSTFVR